MQEVGKPKSWITIQVWTDGFKTRQVSLPREIPYTTPKGTLLSSGDARRQVM